MKVVSETTPVRMVPGAKTILHVIPLESLAQPSQYDVLRFYHESHRCPPLLRGSGWDRRINLEGVVTYNGGPNGTASYTQLFRNGIVEAVEGMWINTTYQGQRTIPYVAFEGGLINYLHDIFGLQKELGVATPLVVALSLTGTKGLEMAREVFSFESGFPIQDEELLLPETIVQNLDESTIKVLKPIFDLIWNACGYAGSRNFDANGNWTQRR